MRGACSADDPWQGYRQKFRVFFREANTKFLYTDTLPPARHRPLPMTAALVGLRGCSPRARRPVPLPVGKIVKRDV